MGPLLSNLHESLLDAVRMGFLHSSRARGRIPNVLKAAADLRFLGHEGDGDSVTVLHFKVPPFGSAAADLFRQPRLWDDGPKAEETAFELFGAALQDVVARREDSDAFDRGLLRRIGSYRNLLKHGVDRIGMPDTLAPRRGSIDAAVVSAARDLVAATPNSRRVRVVGRLDVMGVSQSVLKLEVEPQTFVTAVWEGDSTVDTFKDLLNRDVVVEGLGVFRPSGALLRIDADALATASPTDDFFRRVPSAPVLRDYQKLVRLKPGEKSVYAQILGSIPAEESDEEFEAALAALR
jgi:hypothetical protein